MDSREGFGLRLIIHEGNYFNMIPRPSVLEESVGGVKKEWSIIMLHKINSRGWYTGAVDIILLEHSNGFRFREHSFFLHFLAAVCMVVKEWNELFATHKHAKQTSGGERFIKLIILTLVGRPPGCHQGEEHYKTPSSSSCYCYKKKSSSFFRRRWVRLFII